MYFVYNGLVEIHGPQQINLAYISENNVASFVDIMFQWSFKGKEIGTISGNGENCSRYRVDNALMQHFIGKIAFQQQRKNSFRKLLP